MKSKRRIWPRPSGRHPVVAGLALLGFLFHLLLSIGHVDGPVHRDGFLQVAIENALSSGKDHISQDHDRKTGQQDCSLCAIAAVAAAGTPAGYALSVPAIVKFEQLPSLAVTERERLYALHYAIRGPPLA